MSERTTVHLLRHGEVHNPRASSTAGCPATTSPSSGQQMAQRVADAVGDRDITHVVASPLERAQETAAAAGRGARRRRSSPTRGSSSRPTSSRAAGSASATASSSGPSTWRHLWNPFRPSWGEPYKAVVARMMAAVYDARDAARGHEAVVVSHQLPIWITRLHVEGRSLPAQPAQPAVHAVQPDVAGLRRRRPGHASRYSEPAADLIPVKDRNAPFSAGGAATTADDRRRPHEPLRPPSSPPARRAAAWAPAALAGCSSDRSAARATRATSRARASSPRLDGRRPQGSPGAVAGTTLDGEQVSLADYRGKVVVVNVWGSWCAPCRAEAPMLADAARDLRDEGRGVPRHQHPRPRAPATRRRSCDASRSPTPASTTRTGRTLLAFHGTLTPNSDPEHRGHRQAGPGRRQRARRDHPHHARRPRRGRRRGEPRDRRSTSAGWFREHRPVRLAAARAAGGAGRRPGVVLLARASCRCCPATSPTPPACPASTSSRRPARPDGARQLPVRARVLVRLRRATARSSAPLGDWLLAYSGRSASCSALLTILLGVAFVGLVPWLQRDVRVHRVPAVGLAAAPLLGVLFGLGWTPCIGPTLAAVQALAVRGHRRARRAAQRGLLASGSACRSSSPGWRSAGCSAPSRWVRRHQRGSPGSAG